MSKVSKGAATPYKVGGCPHFLRGIFVAVKESERLTVEAVRHRSYEQALQALAVNPLVPGVEAAKTFLDRVLKEEQIELH
jgi:6-phospho-beta-glucosidase